MIFVTIGNDGRHFERLLDRIGELIKEDFDDIFVQFGNSRNSLKTSNKVKAFYNRDEFSSLLKDSDLIFTHAGAGTLLQIAQLGKFPLVVPRLKKYKEHINNHQVDIASEFEKKGLCKTIYNINDLDLSLISDIKHRSLNFKISNKDNKTLKNSLKNDFYKHIRL